SGESAAPSPLIANHTAPCSPSDEKRATARCVAEL
ncbi:MAG: hypothetical protein QOE08_1049, partial [Thermoleophilaceae bacterium]|nr:hypothetical protein [Thermoleophilaceae bacterium]